MTTDVVVTARSEDLTTDLAAFQTSSWFSRFKSVCFPTRFVRLSPSAVEYLESDRIWAQDLPSAVPPPVPPGSGSIDEADSNTDNDDAYLGHVHAIASLKAQIGAEIEQLGGEVMPKLNWSAPIDATWISPEGLRCTNPDEVLLLLKSSERAAHDLQCIGNSPTCTITHDRNQLQQHSEATSCYSMQPEVVLKQFRSLDHSREFRAFVLEKQLVGISQRDPTQHFPAIQDDLDSICYAITSFFQQRVAENFHIPHYALDVYVTKKHTVKLLDFNPAYGTTQALLFTWDELQEVCQDLQSECDHCSNRGASGGQQRRNCELRAVRTPMHIQTSAKSMFGAPRDTLDMPGVSWPGVIDALQMQCHLQACDTDAP